MQLFEVKGLCHQARVELEEKFDAYKNARHGIKKNSVSSNKPNFRSEFSTSEDLSPLRHLKNPTTEKHKEMHFPRTRTIQCYGCGIPYDPNVLLLKL
ncbi:hypothetical protein NPIL_381021 [Nephila pilipes]|uniref:Uncharacterized protein n=1 Tax=Nephila pilipes TaxID=299642 RepID=A0A8X6J749_NEPPI|nr:hypothetical protein NPIL_381021 [Nephila pilipes]